jgi:hypothetical protein
MALWMVLDWQSFAPRSDVRLTPQVSLHDKTGSHDESSGGEEESGQTFRRIIMQPVASTI